VPWLQVILTLLGAYSLIVIGREPLMFVVAMRRKTARLHSETAR
jgi:hypothetical protein